jgi:hypothetical protein
MKRTTVSKNWMSNQERTGFAPKPPPKRTVLIFDWRIYLILGRSEAAISPFTNFFFNKSQIFGR